MYLFKEHPNITLKMIRRLDPNLINLVGHKGETMLMHYLRRYSMPTLQDIVSEILAFEELDIEVTVLYTIMLR